MHIPENIKIRYAFVPEKETDFHLELAKQLSKEEQNIWQSFRNERQRLDFLYGRMLLRQTLTEATGKGIPEAKWSIALDSYGRPTINGTAHLPALSFSISHSHKAVCVAVSGKFHVGLDIERIPEKAIDISAALTPEEVKYLSGLEPSAQIKEVITIWTVKEAYSKFLGLGLFMDFQELTVDLAQDRLLLNDETGCPQSEPVNIFTKVIEAENNRYVMTLCYGIMTSPGSDTYSGLQIPHEGLIYKNIEAEKNVEFFPLAERLPDKSAQNDGVNPAG